MEKRFRIIATTINNIEDKGMKCSNKIWKFRHSAIDRMNAFGMSERQ